MTARLEPIPVVLRACSLHQPGQRLCPDSSMCRVCAMTAPALCGALDGMRRMHACRQACCVPLKARSPQYISHTAFMKVQGHGAGVVLLLSQIAWAHPHKQTALAIAGCWVQAAHAVCQAHTQSQA